MDLDRESPSGQCTYRANVVTYAVAKLSQAIEEQCRQRTLELRQLWAQQSLPNALQGVLQVLSKTVFDVIVNPEAGLQNVTEWCKKRRAGDAPVSSNWTSTFRPVCVLC